MSEHSWRIPDETAQMFPLDISLWLDTNGQPSGPFKLASNYRGYFTYEQALLLIVALQEACEIYEAEK